MEFTPQQQRVIDDRGHELLVSAAAGSGKTAVLVERIIRRVISGETDIDRVLVVTFTKAAAAEMKQRLHSRLSLELSRAIKEGDREVAAHLQRQMGLVRGACISTIDSFCSLVLRNDFDVIGLDPSFRVASDGELKLLRREVMEELLEDEYERGDAAFTSLVEALCTGSSDRELEAVIERLHDFSRSKAEPGKWLDTCAENYGVNSIQELFSLPVLSGYFALALMVMEKMCDQAEDALLICDQPGGPSYLEDILKDEKEAFERSASLLSSGAGLQEVRLSLVGIDFVRLPSKPKDEPVDEVKKKLVQKLRNDYKDAHKKLLRDYFPESMEGMLETVRRCEGYVRELVRLAKSYGDRFALAKRERDIADFSDLEHLALDIFYEREGKDQSGMPSKTADQYRRLFDEIYVDEYQDSNEVQEKIVRAICRSGNVFMVGDVKQSIYRFRLATPLLFMEKEESFYRPSGDEPVKDTNVLLDLDRNFRSRSEVIDTVNYLFEALMTRAVGHVEYDERASLKQGAVYPEGSDCTSELMLIRAGGGDDKKELEAMAVARRIRELLECHTVSDGAGGMRPVRYGDIVVLLRTARGWEHIYKRVLEENGIPVYTESREGYFSGYEVVTVLDMLSVIDNPCDDDRLCAAMKGFFGGFSDEELALIRIAGGREGSFYDAAMRAADIQDIASVSFPEDSECSFEELSVKLHTFFALIDEYAALSEYMSIRELISKLITDSGFELCVFSMDRGDMRRENLNMLLQRAGEFEESSYRGLFNFISYIKKLKKYSVDFGQAQALSENDDVVRIMTVHKSKGLEFPICFVAGLGKAFNLEDTRNTILMDADGGIGINYVDIKRRIKKKSVIKKSLAELIKRENLGEELRVLYVALTRAKEKLIMSTVLEDSMLEIMKKYNARYNVRPLKRGVKSYEILEGKSLGDWLIRCLSLEPEFNKLHESIEQNEWVENEVSFMHIPLTVSLINAESLIDKEIINESERDLNKQDFLQIMDVINKNDKNEVGASDLSGLSGCFDNDYDDIFGWNYEAGSGRQYVPLKVSVSQLKEAAIEEIEGVKLFDGDEDILDYVNPPDSSVIFETKYNNDNNTTARDALNNGALEADKTLVQTGKTSARSRHNIITTDIPEEPVPAFIRRQAGVDEGQAILFGSLRGSAYHRMFELLDYSGDLSGEGIRSQIEDFCKRGYLDDSQAATLDPSDYVTFINSSVGERMRRAAVAGQLRREQPFCISLPADRVREDYPAGESILVQGIIDALFLEDGEYVIVDYKTDRVDTLQELIQLYRLQLEYYARAVEQIRGIRVKECIIYSVKLGALAAGIPASDQAGYLWPGM